MQCGKGETRTPGSVLGSWTLGSFCRGGGDKTPGSRWWVGTGHVGPLLWWARTPGSLGGCQDTWVPWVGCQDTWVLCGRWGDKIPGCLVRGSPGGSGSLLVQGWGSGCLGPLWEEGCPRAPPSCLLSSQPRAGSDRPVPSATAGPAMATLRLLYRAARTGESRARHPRILLCPPKSS